jgi:uncharacterized protein YdaU (DUF1376 family)
MIWFKFHLGDFSQDTLGISQCEEGSYILLLRAAYSSERGIPKEEVYGITKARTAAERRATDKILSKFWKLQDDGYHQKRVDEELNLYREKSEKAASSAQARWMRTQCDGNANAMRTDMPTHSERNANGMLARSQEPEKRENNLKTKQRGNSDATDPAVVRIAALRSVCSANRVEASSARANMHLGQWANEELPDKILTDAIAIARANGKPDPAVIPLAYLIPIVHDLRNGARQPIEPRGLDAIPIAIANIAAKEAAKAKAATLADLPDEPENPTERPRRSTWNTERLEA